MNSEPALKAAELAPQVTIPRRFWLGASAITALFAICYAPTFYNLGQIWLHDDNMSHGLFVPIAAGYIAWDKCKLLATLKPKANYWGLSLVILGAVLLCIGPPSLPTFAFIIRTSFLFSLVGTILFLGGKAIVRALALPLLLLPLMIPLPAFIYDRLTLPLQILASTLAENFLTWMGYSVLREGNILHMATQTLSVAEACSGLRSLYALTFLTLTYSYFFAGRNWIRWVLIGSIIPVAVIANAGRVTITAILGTYDQALTQGTYHEMLGWVVFVIAFCILFGLNQILKKSFGRSDFQGAAI